MYLKRNTVARGGKQGRLLEIRFFKDILRNILPGQKLFYIQG